MNHTEICVIFHRKPEVEVLALVRSQEDARMFVEQKLATVKAGVEIVPRENPRMKKWLEAEWAVIAIPEEPQYVLGSKE